MVFALLLMSLPVLAGDPCPISIRVVPITPSWRSAASDLAALESQAALYGVTWGARGDAVVVRAVIPGGGGAQAGLAPGDVITEMDGVLVSSHEAVSERFDAAAGAPIRFTVRRGSRTLTVVVAREPVDPVVDALVAWAGAASCRSLSVAAVSDAQQAAVMAGAFDEQRGFRCADAHGALASAFEPGDLVLVRGGKRLLFAAPGVGSRCVAVGALDGASLSPASVSAVVEAVLAPYIRDRHASP